VVELLELASARLTAGGLACRLWDGLLDSEDLKDR